MYQIISIQAQHDADICRIIQQVGAQYGAVGDGLGPVRCMAAVMCGCLRISNHNALTSPNQQHGCALHC
ncbi:hypothetical protein [Thiopseudomonas acetoxidans]|uniref:Uncharacterized protein n=1 Tax=Thiopseudomonas acetoxidans TaxID=3041622 RepID=A0ABT7SPM9_9GAMM|nr:hypothetical protein [Thiopseudomonas sp. CY1220]MDM7858146.1 hypothetical protein [Thiopseudomonas sp. CY1220]